MEKPQTTEVLSSQRGILKLPLEIITMIAAELEIGRRREAFALTCSDFNHGTMNTPWKDIEVEFWGRRFPYTDKLTPDMDCIFVDGWTSRFSYAAVHDSPRVATCNNRTCGHCALIQMLEPLEALLHTHNISKQINSLIIRGYTAKRIRDLNSRQCRCALASGLPRVDVKIFRFDVCWEYFDAGILASLRLESLATLEIPVNFPGDCVLLGVVLERMSGLKSLTILDLPDDPGFIDGFKPLGQGILGRATSLQELDISMTSINRPNPYHESDLMESPRDMYHIFVTPKKLNYHFQQLFPSSQTLEERNRRRFIEDRHDIHNSLDARIYDRGPLKLKKLRLKNLGIPAYASQEIFDWSFLKDLQLPCTGVDPKIWQDLHHTQVESLKDINYLTWPGPLMDSLVIQNSLKVVSFARPPDLYEYTGAVYWDSDMPYHEIIRIHEAPSQGPGTPLGRKAYQRVDIATKSPAEVGHYPTLHALLLHLRNCCIKELRIPPDMYDVTPDVMDLIATTWPNLEHLIFGFNYVDTELKQAFVRFLSRMLKLRRVTLCSLERTYLWYKQASNFDPLKLQYALEAAGPAVPPNLRYIRYLYLCPHRGSHEEAGTFYHMQERKDGKWWMQIDPDQAVDLYEDDQTPRTFESARCTYFGTSINRGQSRQFVKASAWW